MVFGQKSFNGLGVLVLMVVVDVLAPVAHAQYTGPFAGKPTGVTLQRTIVNWLDNVTVGAVQTSIGATHFVVSMIGNPIIGERFPTPALPDSNHGQQIVVDESMSLNGVGYSLGLFNVGPESARQARHEAGHSQQSAVLGPLYLPTVLLDYLVESSVGGCFPYSCGHEFVEKWADIEADNYVKMPFTKAARVGAGFIRSSDAVLPVLVVEFELDERFDASSGRGQGEVRVQKFYEWLKTQLVFPLTQSQEKIPLFFEINALKKTVVVDQPIVAGLNVRLRSEQAYARLTHAPGSGVLRFDALEWAPGVGLSADFGSPVQVFATASGTLALSSVMVIDEDVARSKTVPVTLGAGARLLAGVTLWDFASLYGKYEKEWLFGAQERSLTEIGVTNVYRSPRNRLPSFLNYFDVNTRFVHETTTFPGQEPASSRSNTIDSFFLTIGGRF